MSASGADPSDVLVLEFVDRRGAETALVTFEGVTTLVDREEAHARELANSSTQPPAARLMNKTTSPGTCMKSIVNLYSCSQVWMRRERESATPG